MWSGRFSRISGRTRAVAVLGLLVMTLVLGAAGYAVVVRFPPVCMGYAISVAEGAIGDESADAAFQRWRTESGIHTPHFGWVAVPEEGAIRVINGRWRVHVLDLSHAGGRGWIVTESAC